MRGDLILLPCVDDDEFTHVGLIEGLARGIHVGEEGLLSPLCGGFGALVHGGSILLPSLHSGHVVGLGLC
jgi:hypothetical protein